MFSMRTVNFTSLLLPVCASDGAASNASAARIRINLRFNIQFLPPRIFMVDSRRHRTHPVNRRRTDGLAARSKVAFEDAAFVVGVVQLGAQHAASAFQPQKNFRRE